MMAVEVVERWRCGYRGTLDVGGVDDAGVEQVDRCPARVGIGGGGGVVVEILLVVESEGSLSRSLVGCKPHL